MRASNKYMAIMAILAVIMQGIIASPAFAQKAHDAAGGPSVAAAAAACRRAQNTEPREPPMVSRT